MTHFDHDAFRYEIGRHAAAFIENADVPALVADALEDGTTRLTADGALAVETGRFTGRSPRDKCIVRDSETVDRVWWQANAAIEPGAFDRLLADIAAHLAGRRIHGQTLLAGADPAHRLSVSVLTTSAWHALFIRNLLLRPDEISHTGPADTVTILHAPEFAADPARHGTRTTTVIALDMTRRLVVIAGTHYAGEIKKAVFTVFNYHAPAAGVLPMHCSANVGPAGDTALFFGLSGTGKTTLSNDPARPLIGDDEHGWSQDGIFNLEGGCYAKAAHLSPSAEPEIFAATRRFGTVLENVVLDAESRPDFDDLSLTENTRAAYPLGALPAIVPGGMGPSPRSVIFLTADAFGVLPPIARLSPAQAVEQFLIGYTAKLAGTERGVTEPQATFSTCFGAPFMPLAPQVYGRMLAKRLAASGAAVWLVNTGWTGGGYGTGKRMPLAMTRRLLEAALSGELADAETRTDPRFGLAVPVAVPGVDAALLDPRGTWSDPLAYDLAADHLASLFAEAFARLDISPEAPPVRVVAAE